MLTSLDSYLSLNLLLFLELLYVVGALELTHIQVVIEPFGIHELAVGAPLDDLALINDDDLVGLSDGAKPVSNDEAGASAH